MSSAPITGSPGLNIASSPNNSRLKSYIKKTPQPVETAADDPIRGNPVTAVLARSERRELKMRTLLTLVLWAVLLVICWPLAILVLVLWPVFWLLSIPFRIFGALMEALVALAKTLLFLPARLLGYRSGK
jgi:hypothetical protein